MTKFTITTVLGKKYKVTFEEQTIEEVRMWLNGSDGKGGSAKLGDFITVGQKAILNKNHIVELVPEELEEGEEIKDGDPTEMTSDLHKEQHGPKRSSE